MSTACAATCRDLDETWQKFEVSVSELRADGDYVVALGRIYAQHEDLVADGPAGFVFKLRDAKVAWSADEALASAGLS